MNTARRGGKGQDLDEHVLSILRETIRRSEEYGRKDEVARALFYFLVRVANTWRSIRTLRQHTQDDGFMIDAGTLLRAMLDAWLQTEYLLHDPDKKVDRAKEYLDFEHVERYRISRKVLRHDNPFADRLKSSPKRPEGEKRLVEQYDRVKGKYLVKARQTATPSSAEPRTRDKWYSGDLSAVSRSLGKEVEYDAFVATFNGCVHSSAFAVQAGPMVSPEHVLTIASKIAARVARLNVLHNGIDLGEYYGPIMEALCADFFR